MGGFCLLNHAALCQKRQDFPLFPCRFLHNNSRCMLFPLALSGSQWWFLATKRRNKRRLLDPAPFHPFSPDLRSVLIEILPWLPFFQLRPFWQQNMCQKPGASTKKRLNAIVGNINTDGFWLFHQFFRVQRIVQPLSYFPARVKHKCSTITRISCD